MLSFDFIASKEFRSSLEADYSEMENCLNAGAWKASLVLAGSIVETLLIDYLQTVPNPERPKKNALQIDLGDAISFCKNEGVLTQRTADMCSVIKSYRNLIHPGRVVRLGEPQPNRDSAFIGRSLVSIIVDELERIRRSQVGLTAEQIVSKVVRDSDSLTILKHLVLEASDVQKEKLLLDVIPEAFFKTPESVGFDEDDVGYRLASAYRLVLEIVSPAAREKVAQEFVRVLREEDGAKVSRYCDAFFLAGDLKFVPPQHKAIVREYLLGRFTSASSPKALRILKGICPYLEPGDASKWVDLMVRALFDAKALPFIQDGVREQLKQAFWDTKSEFDDKVRSRLSDWKAHYKKSGASEKAAALEEIEDDMIPF